MERMWAANGKEVDPAPWSTFIASCETCHQVLLYDNPADQLEEKDFIHGGLIFPNAGQLRSSVPELI
jgi:hypothetical protein